MLRHSPRIKIVIALGLLAAVVLAVFSPCLKAGFSNWDDDRYILNNHLVRNLSGDNIRPLLASTVNRNYTPLTLLSFGLENRLFGLNPFVFHLNNLLLHLGVVLLVFYLAGRLGLTLPAAFLAALLFGVHPLHVEPVAWITARKDVLYSFLYLLSICAWWRYAIGADGKKGFYFLSLGLGLLSVLAKPMALSLPWILLLFDWLARRRWTARVWMEKLPFFLLIEPVALMTFRLHAEAPAISFPSSPLLWLWSFAFYIGKFFLPLRLPVVYTLPQPVGFGQPAYLAALVIAALFAAGLFFFRRNRLFLFAALFYCGSAFFLWRLEPGDFANVVADRFMYLPSLGFCLLAGYYADRLLAGGTAPPSRRRAGRVFLAVIYLALAARSFQQCRVWDNPRTFWEYVLRYSADTSFAHNNLGEILSRKGEHEEAVREFSLAQRLNPQNALAYFNQAVSLTILGDYDQALGLYDRTIRLEPGYAKAYNNRAFINSRIRPEYGAALTDLTAAIRLDPYLAEAHTNRGWISYLIDKQYDFAVEDFSRAIELKQDNAEAYYWRGKIYSEVKRYYGRARADFDQAIRHDPTFAEGYQARGFALTQLGEKAAALADFNEAIRLNPEDYAAWLNRGTIYLERENYAEALANYDEALRLNPELAPAHFLRSRALQLSGQGAAASTSK